MPTLTLDLRRPFEMVVGPGRTSVALRPAEWRLMLRLAQEPQCCVAWDALYSALWAEPLAEPGQIYAHACRIRRKLAEAFPDGPDHRWILRTCPKHGMMLDLRADAVRIAGTVQQAQLLARSQPRFRRLSPASA